MKKKYQFKLKVRNFISIYNKIGQCSKLNWFSLTCVILISVLLIILYIYVSDFVFTHLLKHENETEVYGTICCHLNNVLTFWSTTSEKSLFLTEYDFHNSSIKFIKWFKISNELCR